MGGTVFEGPQPEWGIHTNTGCRGTLGSGSRPHACSVPLSGEARQPLTPARLRSFSPHDKLRSLLGSLRAPIGTEPNA